MEQGVDVVADAALVEGETNTFSEKFMPEVVHRALRGPQLARENGSLRRTGNNEIGDEWDLRQFIVEAQILPGEGYGQSHRAKAQVTRVDVRRIRCREGEGSQAHVLGDMAVVHLQGTGDNRRVGPPLPAQMSRRGQCHRLRHVESQILESHGGIEVTHTVRPKSGGGRPRRRHLGHAGL